MSYIGKQPTKAPLTASDIEDGIITAAKIEDGAVVAAEIASNAVTTAKINADAVTSAKIADNAVVTAAINADAVTGAKIADDAINSEHYTDGSVDTAHIADANVTTAKVADDAITAAKLNNDIISGTTALTSEPEDTDEFLVSDAGTLKRIDYSLIKGGGITDADFWRLTTDTQFGTGVQILNANWERADSDNAEKIGNGVSYSGGIFTFPSTGIWLIQHQVSLFRSNGEIQRHDSRIAMTTNNSTFDDAAQSHTSTDDANYRQSTCFSFIFDCENTTTHKIRFYYSDASNNNPTLVGATNATNTGAMFVRLGDT